METYTAENWEAKNAADWETAQQLWAKYFATATGSLAVRERGSAYHYSHPADTYATPGYLMGLLDNYGAQAVETLGKTGAVEVVERSGKTVRYTVQLPRTITNKEKAMYFVGRLAAEGGVMELREACAYVTMPGGATYYYDWSTETLVIEVA